MKVKLKLTKKRLYLLFGLLALSLLWLIVPLTSARFSTTMDASESGDIKVTKVTLNQNYTGSTNTDFIAYFGLSKLYGYQKPEREAHEFRGYYAEKACENLVIDEAGYYQPNTTYVDENGNWQYNSKTKVTLYAKWEKVKFVISFKNRDGKENVVINGNNSIIVDKGSTFTVPNAPDRVGEYFLGWALSKNSNRVSELYVPAENSYQTAIKSTLNTLDQNYLCLNQGTSFTIDEDTTLYANYIKTLPVTVDPTDTYGVMQEFIWNNAVWRTLKAENNRRLIIKISGLTAKEMGTGDDNTTEGKIAFREGTGSKYYTSENDTGYGSSELKSKIDYFYDHYINNNSAVKKDVLAVDLDLPIFNDLKTVDTDGNYLNNDINIDDNLWYWTGNCLYDKDFATSLSDIITNDGTDYHFNEASANEFKKQAFALSFGDINKWLPISSTYGKRANLLYISSTTKIGLRSIGSHNIYSGLVTGYDLGSGRTSSDNPVRPALWISTVENHLVTFESGESASKVAGRTVLAGETLGTLPEPPTKSGWQFVNWYTDENYETEATADMQVTEDMVVYAKWTGNKHTITLNQSKAHSGTTTQGTVDFEITIGSAIPAGLIAPTNTSYIFTGYWTGSDGTGIKALNGDMTANTEATDYWNADGTWKYDNDLTLYPKWEIEEIDFADSRWRVLKKENGNALIIKTEPLTKIEATGVNDTTVDYVVRFRDGEFYFTNKTGENGYEASGSSTTYLKGSIDYYYTHTIAMHSDVSRVLIVDLHNPTFTEFITNMPFDSSFDGGWYFGQTSYDTRFATEVRPEESGNIKKQAFALSIGDINTTMGLYKFGSSPLFNFSVRSTFWLRSVGRQEQDATDAGYGGFYGSTGIMYGGTRPVRPALWIDLGTPWQVAVKKDGAPYSGKTLTLKQDSDVKGTATTGTDGLAHFSGVADGTYDLYDGETKLEANVEVTHGDTGTALNFWTVSFDTDGGSPAPPPQVIYSGQNATAPSSNPTKDGNIFDSWVTTQDGSESFTFTNITEAKTAFAKWTRDVSAGNEITFANSQWRILKNDGKGNALIIKKNVLTLYEATGQTGDDLYKAKLRAKSENKNRYFTNVTGENGYEAGSGDTTYLKGAIDYYYNETIVNSIDAERVLIVDLHNPSFSDFITDVPFGSANNSDSILNWIWDDYYKDTRFATTVELVESATAKKQAFALSYGDINTTMALNGESESSLLLAFDEGNYYLLRSPCDDNSASGAVYTSSGNFWDGAGINNARYVRPALWIKLD